MTRRSSTCALIALQCLAASCSEGSPAPGATPDDVHGYWAVSYTLPEESEAEVITVELQADGANLAVRTCSTERELVDGDWVVTDVSCTSEPSQGTADGTSFAFTIGTGSEAAQFQGDLTSPTSAEGTISWAPCACEFSFSAEKVVLQ